MSREPYDPSDPGPAASPPPAPTVWAPVAAPPPSPYPPAEPANYGAVPPPHPTSPPPNYAAAPPPPPPGYLEAPPAAEERPLADRIMGAVAHDGYKSERFNRHQTPLGPDGQPLPLPAAAPKRESAWNAPAYGMLAIFLLALAALVIPQYRARVTEGKLKPIITSLAARPAGARCPRYITQVFTDVGSVSLDSNGTISDHTDLTGPICSGMRRLLTTDGRAEMKCLLTDGPCPTSSLKSVIALSTVTHESMHLRGILDEEQAECESISEGERAGVLAGLTPEEGRMIGYLHLEALNPNTPPQYAVDAASCPGAADLLKNPPGTPVGREILTASTESTWINLASPH